MAKMKKKCRKFFCLLLKWKKGQSSRQLVALASEGKAHIAMARHGNFRVGADDGIYACIFTFISFNSLFPFFSCGMLFFYSVIALCRNENFSNISIHIFFALISRTAFDGNRKNGIVLI